MRHRTFTALVPILLLGSVMLAQAARAQDAPTLEIVWPPEGSSLPAGKDALGAVGVIVKSNFKLKPAGQCGDDPRCGHIHLKVDPDGDTCNLPGRPYNSMNSDFGGDLIKAHIGACPAPKGEHVIGVLLANDRHQPVLMDGKPVTALRRIHVNP